ncbi:MAG: 6-bladed beta-propeller [Desulfuromonas sp.]|nr:6-bladed beta-propeller [Desulfuromonas sp.]
MSRQTDLVWPKPPVSPRIGYLRTLTGPQDFVKADRRQGFLDWLVGERELTVPLLTPTAVTADGKGRVWVADSSARMVFRFDLSRERIDYFRQVGEDELQSPSGVAFDPRTERLYVADAQLGKVFVLGKKGELLGEIAPPEGFQRPGGLVVDDAGGLYVADALGGEICVFDAAGHLQRRIGSRSTSDGRFQRPTQVALGPRNELLVVDALRFLIEIQDASGRLLGVVGQVGDVPGSFARPRGVAVDSAGHVYVADAAFDNIQIFDLTGQLLLYWGGSGSAHGQFNLPAGLFIDDADRVYVADSYNHRVEVFAYFEQPPAPALGR